MRKSIPQHKSEAYMEEASSFRSRHLSKLGVNMNGWDYVVALAGNPNTGKSTVFNSLTGLRQHTGNWPGKTVSRAEGGMDYKDNRYKLVDLPGTYSLLSASEDEEVARNFLLFGKPDVVITVVDATRLQRNLNLALQILEITPNLVLCLNLMDEARRLGMKIDIEALEGELGVPVVPVVARYNKGLDKLLDATARIAGQPATRPVYQVDHGSTELKQAIEELQADIERLYPSLPNTRWLAMRLLDGDERIEEALASGEMEELVKRYTAEPRDLNKELEQINQELELSYG